MYSNKQFISIGTKNFDNFGKYRHLSRKDNGGVSVVIESFSSTQSSNIVGTSIAFVSLMNKNATIPTNGTTSININIVLGVKPTYRSKTNKTN